MKTNVPDRVFQTHKSQDTIDRDPELRAAQGSWMRATRDYRFYDDAAQDKMMREHFPDLYPLWARLPLPVMKADVWRYAVIYKYGGIYADADTVYLRPDTALLRPPCLLTLMPERGAGGSVRVDACNWWFSAPAGSPVLRSVLAYVKSRLERGGPIQKQHFLSDYHLIHAVTGPKAMTEGVKRWAAEQGWDGPEAFCEWEMNRVARRLGLCIYRHHSINGQIVRHLVSGQWDGGWLEQRSKYTGITEEEWNARNKKQ